MPSANTRSTARIVLLAALSIIGIACISLGALPFGEIVGRWLRGDFDFPGMEGLEWVAGVFGIALICIGLLVAGIALRLSKWDASPRASLGLSIASAAFLLAAFSIFIQAESQRAHGGFKLLAGVVLAGLIVASLPPFLHWLLARRRHQATAISRASAT